MLRPWTVAGLILALPLSAIAAEAIPVSEPRPVTELFGATEEQSQLRAAIVDASWDLPYEVLVRIQGVDQTDRERIEENLEGLIDPQTASVRVPFLDLGLGSHGPDAIVERIYNSRDTSASEFGTGWSWSFGARITKSGSDLLLHDGFGGEVVFKATGEKSWAASMLGQQVELKSDGYFRTATGAAEAERYDKNGFLVVRMDAAGKKVAVQRDRKGLPLAIVAANGRKLAVKTDANGKIVSITDPAGRAATYAYKEGRLAKSVVAGLETAYAYDAEGMLTMVTFPDAASLVLRYNGSGWVNDIRMGERAVKASFTSNPASPAVHGASIQDGTETTRYQFDELGGRADIVHPDGAKEAIKADLARRSVSEVALGSEKSRYEYDALGRLTRVRGVDGTMAMTYGPRSVRTLEFALEDGTRTAALFDDAGNMVRIQGEGHTVEVRYENGLPVETRVNGTVARRSEYDATGDLTAIHDEKGRTLRIRYDAAGMVTALQRPDAALVEIAPQDGAFLPKIRVSRKLPAGVDRRNLAFPEMAFLYGDLASARPSKRAGLDSIPGVKFAGLGNLPLSAGVPVLAGCFEQLFLCQVGFSFKCLGVKLLNDLSPIGSPFDFDPKTGEYKFDPKNYIWNQVSEALEDAFKDAAADAGKMALKDIATSGSGWWRRAAQNTRNTIAFGKRVARVLKPLIKKLGLPLKLLMAVKTAYDCATEVSDNSMTLCNPDRVCAEPKPLDIPRTPAGQFLTP